MGKTASVTEPALVRNQSGRFVSRPRVDRAYTAPESVVGIPPTASKGGRHEGLAPHHPPGPDRSRGPRARRPRRERAARARPPTARTPASRSSSSPRRPSCRASTTGFDWASAAIGAGFAGGIILLISWGGVTYRHRHQPSGARALTLLAAQRGRPRRPPSAAAPGEHHGPRRATLRGVGCPVHEGFDPLSARVPRRPLRGAGGAAGRRAGVLRAVARLLRGHPLRRRRAGLPRPARPTRRRPRSCR